MAKRLRVQFKGAIYHVMNRGIDRRTLFWDQKDAEWFLECLAVGVERFHVRVFLYCLLPNHFHLLVETPLANLSQFMLSVQTRYGGYFNRRHRKRGYVFQGPYAAKWVEGNRYLLKLSRYLHLNPVEMKGNKGKNLTEKTVALRNWAWSSYREYIGKAPRKGWISYSPVEQQVRELMGNGRDGYRRFVEAGLAENDLELAEAMAGSSLGIGSEGFIQKMKGRIHRILAEQSPAANDVFRQTGTWLEADDVLQRVCRTFGVGQGDLLQRRGGGWLRGVAAAMLTKYAGITQQETARRLGMGTGAAVSMRLKALAQQRQKDRGLDARIKQLNREMRERLLA